MTRSVGTEATQGLPLERAVIPWTRVAWPIPWENQFERRAPLGVELGFGNGEYLMGLARRHPETNWVGVEVSWASVQRLLARLRAERMDNVRIAQGDAAYVLAKLFPPASLTEVVINHPDPWPKQRHQARRLVQPAFMSDLARKLEPGGRVTLVTDHAEYADWIEDVLRGEPGLAPAHGTPRTDAVPGRSPTKYERKALALGCRIHYFVWERRGAPAASAPVERMEVQDMPNALLEGPVEGREILSGAVPRAWTETHGGETVHIQFLAVFCDAARSSWLVETRVEDGGFHQHLMLAVIRRSDGRLLVRPAPVGFPRPTRGVKRGVRLLVELLLAAHPGLKVVTSTVGSPEEPPGTLT